MTDAPSDTTLSDAPNDQAPTDDAIVEDGKVDADMTMADEGADTEAPKLSFDPSNFPTTAIDWTQAKEWVISKANCDATCLPSPTVLIMNDSAPADLYVMRTLRIDRTAAITLQGSRPVILAVSDAVDIQGKLIVAANGPYAGPGGFSGGVSLGPGGGEQGGSATAPNSGSGGASYCGVGGSGGASAGAAAGPGKIYGSSEIVPLMGGSAAGEAPSLIHGGAGGGAIQIVAGTSIAVRLLGAIHAGGGGGTAGTRASGGGSGGAILLEAPTIIVDGNLAANGGGGGQGGPGGVGGASASADDQAASGGAKADVGGNGGNGSAGATISGLDGLPDSLGTVGGGGGGGGAGRIRVNTDSGSAAITGIISPGLATPCASQGTLAH